MFFKVHKGRNTAVGIISLQIKNFTIRKNKGFWHTCARDATIIIKKLKIKKKVHIILFEVNNEIILYIATCKHILMDNIVFILTYKCT